MCRVCSYGKSRVRSDWKGSLVLLQVLHVYSYTTAIPTSLFCVGCYEYKHCSLVLSRGTCGSTLCGEGGGVRLLVQERGSFNNFFILCFSIRVRRGGLFLFVYF